MIRAVVDPGVLVSAFISPHGSAPDKIVRSWYEGAFELIVSPHLVAELATVLSRPKFDRYGAEGRADAYVSSIAPGALTVADPENPPAVTKDPADDYLIALAKYADANVVVSGDRHLLEIDETGVEVITPREFIGRLAQ